MPFSGDPRGPAEPGPDPGASRWLLSGLFKPGLVFGSCPGSGDALSPGILGEGAGLERS